VLGAMSCVPKASGDDSLENIFGLIESSMEKRTKKLLLVTSTDALAQEIRSFIGGPDVEFIGASTAREAMQVIAGEYLDGIVLDWIMSDTAGTEFIEEVHSKLLPFAPPVVVFGSRKLNQEQAAELRRLSRISSVRYAPSLERLLDETMLLLHRSEEGLSEQQAQILADVRQTDPMLAGRKVLVIDDDLRNIFALTSVL
jgi:CheY-like chemotaxis protein